MSLKRKSQLSFSLHIQPFLSDNVSKPPEKSPTTRKKKLCERQQISMETEKEGYFSHG